jgi:ligand-binding sensor domain-containing protein/putative methionine-R-sulfoxide reductase with GAF domain/anti-sigma regulatory factor (Ser/Thr protein kinase)
LALLLVYQTAAAQLPALDGYIVQTFGAANGLASSEIVSLYQDKKDFIWIGTRSGISRFDGHNFQNFEYVDNNRIGSVNGIAEDNNGTLWIATEAGLYYWNEKNFVPLHFKNESSYLPFYFIHFAADKQTWIGTLKGPLYMNAPQFHKDEPIENLVLPQWQVIAKNDFITKYISSSKKGVAIGGLGEVYYYHNGKIQLLHNQLDPREYLRGVLIDDAGTIYWNNVLSGFRYWDGKEITKPADSKGFYFDLFVKDNKVHLYSNAGIIQVDERTKKQTRLIDIEPLALRMPSVMLIDKEGSYWIGATEGLFRIKKNPFTIHWKQKLMQSDEIYSLLRRRNGELLLGANRGKIFLMKDTMQLYKNDLQVVPAAEVFSIYEDEQEAVWFGSGYQGIALYKNGRLRNFTTRNGLPDNSHYYFHKTKKGEFWSAGDMGLTRIEKDAKDSVRFRPYFYITPIDYHKVYGIAEAADGSIWTGGWLGLFQLKNDSLRRYYLPELTEQKIFITCLRQNKEGEVWITTRGHGILLCRFEQNNLLHLKKQFRTEDGLFSNNYLSLAFDKSNNIWAGNYSGVTALQRSATSNYNIKNFDVKDGFIQKNYQSLSMYSDSDTMWALTSSGAVSFHTSSLLQQKRQAQLYITSIDLLNSTKPAEDYLVKDERKDGIEYNFPNSINSFSIQFAALYYSNPEAIRYYYQLQGVDSGWTSTGSERTIIFRQLPAGNYTLLVKASIGGNDWTNAATILFTINKPWWLQWWAIAAGIGLIALSILYYVKARERKLKLKEKVNTEIEKLKSASYQHQLEIEQVINYFATSLNEHTTVDGVLWDVARNCISRLGFEDCVIYLKNEEGDKLVQKAAWGPKTTEENKIINPIEIPLGKGIVGNVATTGKPQRINDTSKDERYIIDDEARASEITVPIYEGDKVIGVIDSEHRQKNFYTDRHLHILTTIASHCGAKISTLKAEATTASAKMESLLNKQKALEASLQSMRLQMNPHFLFNALNSIQQMILSGDETTATRFLSKFSKLLRTVLTNSDKEEITLKEEMELLQLYVELESLRFKESFDYSIKCDEEIDAEEIYVPALLLQPLVENAIWHGLMHKTGKRILSVRFESCDENCLLCIIEDNGVGRQMATVNGNAQSHTGKGLSVAIERLRTLNEKNNTKNSLQIIDVKDENGLAAGTRIDITLYHN